MTLSIYSIHHHHHYHHHCFCRLSSMVGMSSNVVGERNNTTADVKDSLQPQDKIAGAQNSLPSINPRYTQPHHPPTVSSMARDTHTFWQKCISICQNAYISLATLETVGRWCGRAIPKADEQQRPPRPRYPVPKLKQVPCRRCCVLPPTNNTTAHLIEPTYKYMETLRAYFTVVSRYYWVIILSW